MKRSAPNANVSTAVLARWRRLGLMLVSAISHACARRATSASRRRITLEG
jgi:hypothetical protein